MFFKRKKRAIRRREDERLMNEIDQLREKLDQQRNLLSHRADHSDHLHYQVKLNEAKYLFLLKEVRHRHRTAPAGRSN
ncbi:hypothetical protein CR205_19815 [Alteribacter lacisalsi]|uniref:DUF2508 family protein n=1 Tax=Alteribacter lacisalsi TaxID=2045244 RepID=A0A2W0HP94_9BACI|nr:YaaL family protein [Alteribacter lacisalsi]PYZ95378.1 hypothetical protein CR205_19815 [Alteribacter lacisalsi]